MSIHRRFRHAGNLCLMREIPKGSVGEEAWKPKGKPALSSSEETPMLVLVEYDVLVWGPGPRVPVVQSYSVTLSFFQMHPPGSHQSGTLKHTRTAPPWASPCDSKIVAVTVTVL
jgi:hypothetical protein